MPDESKVNILMLDDDQDTLLTLGLILSELDHNLIQAHSGEEALRHLLNDDYAVILMDVRMLGMDGFETAALIRSRRRSRQTPIIFLTSMMQDSEAFRGYEVGAVDYIIKPVVPEILKSKVAVFVELYNKTLEIKRQEQKYRAIFESFPDIYFSMDREGTIALVSPSILAKLGYPPDEVVGCNITLLYDDPSQAESMLYQLKYAGSLTDYEMMLQHKDGHKVNFSLSARVPAKDAGLPVAFEGVLHDITERKEVERLRAEKSLREQSRVLQSILDSMGDGVVVADAKRNLLLSNPAAEAITGFSPVGFTLEQWAERYGGCLPDMITPYPRDQLPLIRALRGEIINGAEVFVRTATRPNGTWLSVNGRPLRAGDGKLQGGIAVFRDITEQKQSERRLTYLAQYDSLTGLPNRNLFRDRLTQAMARAKRSKQLVALMFLDLDNFKNINDSLGHTAGDLLLKAVAGRLRQCVRQMDTVARLGGDEFTVILEGRTDLQHIVMIAQKILESMSPQLILDGREVFITTSIGIVTYSEKDKEDADVLIKKADMAMYRAKELGRNNYQIYTPQMHDKTNERLAIANNLPRALE